MYKLKQELPKEFKIKVTPEQSEALQLHLFSIGVKWASGSKYIKFTERFFLYRYNMMFCKNDKQIEFKEHKNERIKFKDYFEKVEEKSFPEKWCILVTEENYQELKTWMHGNVGNYLGFKYTWLTRKDLSIGCTMYSHAERSWEEGLKDVFYEEITTEQFRAQFGNLKETKAQGTEIGGTEINGLSYIEMSLLVKAQSQEIENLKAQINVLSKDLGHYYNLKKSIKILINE